MAWPPANSFCQWTKILAAVFESSTLYLFVLQGKRASKIVFVLQGKSASKIV